MIVTRLRLTNVRAIEMADFSFKPGFNLIVGVNGVGKTTVLDSLALCLARVTQKVNRLRGTLHGFTTEDIREGTDALSMICDVLLADQAYSYTIHTPRYPFQQPADKAELMQERPTPAKALFSGDPLPSTDQLKGRRPLAVLYSTRRAVPSDRTGSKAAASGGSALAFAEAFSARDLRLREFADWMLAQKALAPEQTTKSNVLTAFNTSIERFLPGYENLHVTEGKPPQLAIVHGDITVPVRKLSDGERGVLAIVLDLTRRLAIANPELADPTTEGKAVALIDELDLHLHPKCQRQIIRSLTNTFPRVQFIATTHSPQIIGELEHDRIQIMAEGQVFSPAHSYGVDSSRVLEEIMDASPRAREVEDLLRSISREIAEMRLETVARLIEDLTKILGENDPEVIRTRTLLDFLGEEA